MVWGTFSGWNSSTVNVWNRLQRYIFDLQPEELKGISLSEVANATPEADLVGVRLRKSRRLLGLTLRAVAEDCEIYESYLSQIERSRSLASVPTLQRIVQRFGMTMGELFSEDGANEEPIGSSRSAIAELYSVVLSSKIS